MRYVSMNIPLDQAQEVQRPWTTTTPDANQTLKLYTSIPDRGNVRREVNNFLPIIFFIENKPFSAETRSPGNGTGRLIGFVGPPKTANTQSIVSVRVKRRSETKKKQVLNFWIDFSFVSIFRCMTNSISKLSGLEKKSSNLTSSFFLLFKLKKTIKD